MKNKAKSMKMKTINNSRGIERDAVLGMGGSWIRPTMVMESRRKYSRSRAKSELRKNLYD